MQIVINDTATAALDALAARIADKPAMLRSVGEAVAQLAARSFTDASVRPAPWAPLAPATIAAKLRAGAMTQILRRSGLLWRSWRVTSVGADTVGVGTDRPYAAHHQFGTRRIPARPMLPLTMAGGLPQFTPLAVRDMLSAARAHLAG